MGWAHVFVLPPLQKGSFDLLSVDRQTERFNLLVFPLHWPDGAFLSHESCWEHTELFLETQILVKTLKQRESDCRLGWLFRQPVLCGACQSSGCMSLGQAFPYRGACIPPTS